MINELVWLLSLPFEYLSFAFLLLLATWISFAAIAEWIGDKHGFIPWYKKLAAILFIVFLDVPLNVLVATVVFRQLPHWTRLTLTARLRHNLLSGEFEEYEWRWKLSYFTCKHLVSPHDKNHCGMGLN